mgnify:FL=1
MAQPFFKGNYGSSLARIDTQPIIEAGRAQGQMYANMGAQLGGMIQQYGLNKEKQKKQKANIKSTVNFLESLAQNDPAMEDQYASMKEQLLNEDISLTERDTLASQGLKQVSLSSQIKSQQLNQDAQRLANEFQEETRNVRSDLLGQQRDFAQIQNSITALGLDKLEQLQPNEIKTKLAQFSSILDTLPSLTKAKIKQAEGVVRDEGVRDAQVDVRGGPMGVAAQQATVEDLSVEQMEANIDRTRRSTDAIDFQMELMKRPPIDTSIPGNVDIEKKLKEADTTVSRLRNIETSAIDDEGKTLNVSEVLIPDPTNRGFVINEIYSNDLTDDDRKNVNRLIRATAKRSDLSDKQIVPQVIGTDENGQPIIREVTAREDEIMRKKELERLKALELEAEQKEYTEKAFPTDRSGRPTEYVY